MAFKYAPLLVRSGLVENIRAIQQEKIKGENARQVLGELLQSALKLEFATVPAYLSAAFSFKSQNNQIINLLLRIAREEMLHMTVVANLMNAIGVAPNIIAAIPEYPYDLDVLEPPLAIYLESFSFQLVEELFMQIETPEDPNDYPSDLPFGDDELPTTIGQFYENIIDIINRDIIPDLFRDAERDDYKQIKVVTNFKSIAYINNQDTCKYNLRNDINFIITDKNSAMRHLAWVVSEGEGASEFDPLDAEGLPGHYYRFESILKSRYLIKDDTVDEKYSYSGGDLPFSPNDVYEFETNAKVENYGAYPKVEKRMKRFNTKYTEMIDFLHTAFNCPTPEQEQQSKDAYQNSINLMRRMTGLAGKIVRAAETENVKAGIPFQYPKSKRDPILIT